MNKKKYNILVRASLLLTLIIILFNIVSSKENDIISPVNVFISEEDNHLFIINSISNKWIDDFYKSSVDMKFNRIIMLYDKYYRNNIDHTLYIVGIDRNNEWDTGLEASPFGIIIISDNNKGNLAITNHFPVRYVKDAYMYRHDWDIISETDSTIIVKGGSSYMHMGILELFDTYIKISDDNYKNVGDISIYKNNSGYVTEDSLTVTTELKKVLEDNYNGYSIIYEAVETQNNVADTLYKQYSITNDTMLLTKTFTPEEYKAATQGLR